MTDDNAEAKEARGFEGEIVKIARAFHEAYEALAPAFGYETRTESAVPWDQVPHQNRVLMCTVVQALISEGYILSPDAAERLRKAGEFFAKEANHWRVLAETLAASEVPLSPEEFKARYITDKE